MRRVFMRTTVAGIPAIGLAGCTVGPQPRSPEFTATDSYTVSLIPSMTASAPTDSGEA
jgi:hypothetical protein